MIPRILHTYYIERREDKLRRPCMWACMQVVGMYLYMQVDDFEAGSDVSGVVQ